jgi:fructuronate reductase
MPDNAAQPRLSLATLARLPSTVARPAYDPASVPVGILHLGLGAFHRAHQAVYTDDILGAEPRWGICGVSLKTPRAVSPLAAQDGLYTLLTRTSDGTSARVIGALRETLFAGTARPQLIARFADHRISVVTATVTEKGYCHDPATGMLNENHPEIAHDLVYPDTPESAIGILVAGIAARSAANAGPLTFICCDNLPHNGRMVEGLVRAFAARRDPALAAWIADHVTFPSTMVDRIVPATTNIDLADAKRLTGMHDEAAVTAEAFGQWVIDDRVSAARPRWEDAGAQFVADVAPFETMKLRLLNGSHSTLAYLGFLAGHETIWQASADPLLARLVERQMVDEIIPTLVAPPGIDLAAYCAQLMARFRNRALPHRTQQIAMDGSQKLPQRLLGSVRDRIATGARFHHLALATAGWIRYASGTDERGREIAVSDPMAATFARTVAAAGNDPARIAAGFLDLAPVFGDLVAHTGFRDLVSRNVVDLFRNGVQRTLARHLGVD